MGVDFLDIAFEIEKLFGVRITPADLFESPEWDHDKKDCTAGALHRVICQKCEAAGLTVPRSSWNRMRLALMRAVAVAAEEVQEEAWLIRDLGMG